MTCGPGGSGYWPVEDRPTHDGSWPSEPSKGLALNLRQVPSMADDFGGLGRFCSGVWPVVYSVGVLFGTESVKGGMLRPPPLPSAPPPLMIVHILDFEVGKGG